MGKTILVIHRKRSLFGALLIVMVLFVGCQKKERLSTSTATFSISPGAATLLKSENVTLTAQLRSPGGAVSPLSAEWGISGTCVDTNNLNTTVGESIIFSAPTTANEICDAIISATAGGMSTSAQIAIVSYRPLTASNIYNVYSDALGIPANAIDQNATTIAGSTVGYAPEGITYLHLTALINGGQVFISLPSSENLSAFNSGTLKFAIRFAQGGGNYFVKVVDSADRSVTLGPTHGFSNSVLLENTWQEISVNISEFIGAGLNTSAVTKPFLLQKAIAGEYNLDAIRWEQ